MDMLIYKASPHIYAGGVLFRKEDGTGVIC